MVTALPEIIQKKQSRTANSEIVAILKSGNENMNVRFLTSNQILLASPRLRSANVTV